MFGGKLSPQQMMAAAQGVNPRALMQGLDPRVKAAAAAGLVGVNDLATGMLVQEDGMGEGAANVAGGLAGAGLGYALGSRMGVAGKVLGAGLGYAAGGFASDRAMNVIQNRVPLNAEANGQQSQIPVDPEIALKAELQRVQAEKKQQEAQAISMLNSHLGM